MESILIIDDEPFIRENVQRVLSEDGYRVLEAADGAQARELVLSDEVDLALLDLNLGQEDGLELLKSLRELDPHLLVIIITGYGSVESAVEALRLGAYDYVKKPFKADALRVIVKLALQTQELKREVRALKREGGMPGSTPLLGDSPAFTQVVNQLRDVARIPTATVLITGESGTGKELAARAIHTLSDRCDAPFVAVNCASIPTELMESELFGHERGAFTGAVIRKTGLFEEANGGTIFLDEIGDMYASLQAKLLRVLQERTIRRVGGGRDLPVDLRVIAATNRNLQERIKQGTFREDLYYRLNVVPLHLPPLRERREDIGLLAKYFLDSFSRSFGKSFQGISAAALELLSTYAWPGNVRELRNVIERICIMRNATWLEPEHLPAELHAVILPPTSVQPAGGLEQAVAEFERQMIARALAETDGNVVKAALALKIPRGTLRYKMEKYAL
ncbi:sigma-54-dependent transcriptional regulator [Trichlorobacter ammonificans]|nr:sigma-54 dependent transcriptional regulator [Trichlorobacter ammonificans]